MARASILPTLLFFLSLFWIYPAVALQTVAKKTNTGSGWLAWIPIANMALMLNIGKKPLWWIVLFLVPLVNIVIFVLTWMAIAEARAKPTWLGILMMVPVANLFVLGYLAWSN